VDLHVGDQFAGYRIDALIGRGGMGVVYLAADPRLERRVALKVLAPALASSASFRSRFDRESRLAASMDHPHIIPIYEAGEADGQVYLAMRYVEGTDLKTLLQEGPLPVERTVSILDQVADALDAAHSHGLVHRDVKPGNILVAAKVDRGSPEYCYLCDFGLTKPASGASELTGSGQVWGTGDYLAPEQIHGEPVDSRTDVYALGCMVYECLTGSVPYPREHEVAVMFAHLSQPPPAATALRPELPPGIDPVIAIAMAKEKDQRYPTCSALALAVREELLGEPRPKNSPAAKAAPPRPAAAPERVVAGADSLKSVEQELKHWRTRAVVVAVAAVIAIAGGTTSVVLVSGGSSEPGQAVSSQGPLTRPLATVPVGDAPFQLAAGNNELWVALGEVGLRESRPPNAVSRLDVINNQVSLTIPLKSAESGIAVGQGTVWVSVADEGTVLRIDTVKGAVVGTIRVGEQPSAIAVGAGAVWVANTGDNTVSRIDPQTNRVTNRIVVGHEPISIGVGEGAVWVADRGDDSVVRIDPATNQPVAVIQLGLGSNGASSGGAAAGPPVGLAVGEGAVWVAEADGFLVRIDPATNRVNKRFPLRWNPIGIAVGERSVWLVADHRSLVARVDATTGEVLRRIAVGKSPQGIAVAGGAVWVANVKDGTISRVAP
jgi:YVTN family beta-propeller protein